MNQAEEKWNKAKESVDKEKYKDSYYAVVTSIFKKMMGEETIMDKTGIKTFEQFLNEMGRKK